MNEYNSCQSVTLASIDGRCDGAVGGIKRVFISLRDDVTVTPDTSTGKVTIANKTGKKFEQWQFRKQTGSFSSSIAKDNKLGTCVVTTEVSLQFSKAEANKRLAIQSALNAGCVLIIEDMYGQFIFLGYDNEVEITDVNMQSGTETTDLNGFTLTFQDLAIELPHFVGMTEEEVKALLTAGA